MDYICHCRFWISKSLPSFNNQSRLFFGFETWEVGNLWLASSYLPSARKDVDLETGHKQLINMLYFNHKDDIPRRQAFSFNTFYQLIANSLCLSEPKDKFLAKSQYDWKMMLNTEDQSSIPSTLSQKTNMSQHHQLLHGNCYQEVLFTSTFLKCKFLN